jgi:hypothetical protein
LVGPGSFAGIDRRGGTPGPKARGRVGKIVVATNIVFVNPIVVRQNQEVKCLSAL